MAESSFKSDSKYLLVAAFDFGTTYSGYAFSFRDSPLKIQTNQGWNAGSEKLISLKTPTCVLLKPNKEFHSFGFEAENHYANLALDDEHQGWLLFRRFKMVLHNNQDISRVTSIEDINGQSMNAMTIFAMSIRYLKEHLLKCLDNQSVGLKDTDIQYVLTVPAIWNDGAKQFMREAAVEAGIDTGRLKIALEPEAASIWCQTITEEAKLSLSSAGNQYMVIDLGGGTADISVHELNSDGTLKEIHKASGGAWGGTEVDHNYVMMMSRLVGNDVMNRFKEDQMSDYFDMLREFEMKKRTITSDTAGKVTFRLFTSLKEMFEEGGKKFKQAVAESDDSSMITLSGDKLRLDATIVKAWFDKPIQSLVIHIKDILAKRVMKNVDYVVLVGGFGESQLVQEALKTKLKNKRVIIPSEAGLAVLKGAVKFGHTPAIVSERISKYTYGIRGKHTFNSSEHPLSKKQEMSDGSVLCRDIFFKCVSAGETIQTNTQFEQIFVPFSNKSNTSGINIFCTEDPNPTYTTDRGCKLLGQLVVLHQEGETIQDKTFKVGFTFGDTELVVKTEVLKTGHTSKTVIDCL